ncbi:carboxypeptidase A2-like [Penaeus monodon]|uniref:carboxypeptidase A2-like n=1 Tax=Penaeus monodon TaxID=6687 RepID=UPI0018A71CA4|nr:carboxypeptidase A2-like [Penaeus monodon]
MAGQTFFRSMAVVVAPVANPDGYEYSLARNVLWRKNRRQTLNPACSGVDLNRNWSEGWGDPSGSSGDPCANTYRGNASFSEPETQALRDLALAWFDKLTLHISIHSYGGYLLYPWFYTTADISTKPQLRKIAKRMKKYMRDNGHQIQIGQGSKVLYKASGVASDYLHAAGLQYTYVLELPGFSFVPNPQRILPVGRSVWDTLVCAVGDVVGTKDSRCFCGKRIVRVTLSDEREMSVWISKDVPGKEAKQMILDAFSGHDRDLNQAPLAMTAKIALVFE